MIGPGDDGGGRMTDWMVKMKTHLWFCVYFREPGDKYDRCQRLVVLFTGMCSVFLILALFYEGAEAFNYGSVILANLFMVGSTIPIRMLFHRRKRFKGILVGFLPIVIVEFFTFIIVIACAFDYVAGAQSGWFGSMFVCFLQDVILCEPLVVLLAPIIQSKLAAARGGKKEKAPEDPGNFADLSKMKSKADLGKTRRQC